MRKKILVGILILAMLAFLIPSILPPRNAGNNTPKTKTGSKSTPDKRPKSSNSAPTFSDQGDLYFLSDTDTIARIDIEVADTDQKRQQGLMYRNSLKSDGGMLFVFDKTEPQTFWMKNTYIALDLIFIGEDNQILQVTSNALPDSETSIHCPEPTKYVLEVNGGFSNAYGIKAGQTVQFRLNQ